MEQNLAHVSKSLVPFFMSLLVVDFFQTIEVDHRDNPFFAPPILEHQTESVAGESTRELVVHHIAIKENHIIEGHRKNRSRPNQVAELQGQLDNDGRKDR